MKTSPALPLFSTCCAPFHHAGGDQSPLHTSLISGEIENHRAALKKEFFLQNSRREDFHAGRKLLVNQLHPYPDHHLDVLGSFVAQRTQRHRPKWVGDRSTHCCGEKPQNTLHASQSQGCDHDGGGNIVVDLDEAAHGAFASAKYIRDVAQGNPEDVLQSFEDAAAQLSSAPLRYLGGELSESGVAAFSSSVGTAALLLPLAGMAVKAGLEEWQHGTHQLQALRAMQASHSGELQTLQAANRAMAHNPLTPHIQAHKVRTEKIQEAMAEAHKTRHIGLSSGASGLMIGLKASSDIALKTSLGIQGSLSGKSFFALSETAQAGTAAGAAAGLGLAGTLVLGPLAGVFATTLGWFFRRKSVAKLTQLRNDFALVQADLRAAASQRPMDERLHALDSFVVRQGEKRIGFFRNFARWNQAFMVGSGLYACSATTKAVVTGLAIGGVAAAASNPVGLAALTVAGVVGALAMGVASLSFFRGHAKQGKYAAATAADHEAVDRTLMTDLHSMAPTRLGPANACTNGPTATHPYPGFAMASACLQHLDSQKESLQHFLAQAGQACGKHSPLEKNLSWWTYLRGRVVKPRDIQKFIQTDEGKTQFTALTQNTLLAESRLLADRIEQRQQMTNAWLPSLLATTETSNAAPAQAGAQWENLRDDIHGSTHLSRFFERLDKNCEKDQAALELTLRHLKSIASGEVGDVLPLASYIHAGDNVKDMSAYLHHGMDKNLRNARGVLFESQLEGARVRFQQHNERVSKLHFKTKRVEI